MVLQLGLDPFTRESTLAEDCPASLHEPPEFEVLAEPHGRRNLPHDAFGKPLSDWEREVGYPPPSALAFDVNAQPAEAACRLTGWIVDPTDELGLAPRLATFRRKIRPLGFSVGRRRFLGSGPWASCRSVVPGTGVQRAGSSGPDCCSEATLEKIGVAKKRILRFRFFQATVPETHPRIIAAPRRLVDARLGRQLLLVPPSDSRCW